MEVNERPSVIHNIIGYLFPIITWLVVTLKHYKTNKLRAMRYCAITRIVFNLVLTLIACVLTATTMEFTISGYTSVFQLLIGVALLPWLICLIISCILANRKYAISPEL